MRQVCQQIEVAYTRDIASSAALASDAITALQQLEARFPDRKTGIDTLIARAQNNPSLGDVVFFTTRTDFCQTNGYSP